MPFMWNCKDDYNLIVTNYSYGKVSATSEGYSRHVQPPQSDGQARRNEIKDSRDTTAYILQSRSWIARR